MAARVVAQGLIEGSPNRRIRRWRCVSLTARGCRLDEMPAYRIERATVGCLRGNMYETRNDLQESARKSVVQLRFRNGTAMLRSARF
jgi:hypothetical protein